MTNVARILIVGAGGRLGAALQRHYSQDFSVRGFCHADLDLTDHAALRDRLSAEEFDLLINSAAFTNVDGCEKEREHAIAVNATAPGIMAEVCREQGAKFIHISTDYVFDGEGREPYRETDSARPISFYGESKLRGEEAALMALPNGLVARASWIFGPDRPSFVDQMLKKAREATDLAAVADKFSAPTYAVDLVRWLRAAWEADLAGLLHLANAGKCSWQEYAQHALDCCRAEGIAMKASQVGALKLADMTGFIARRPVYSVLDCTKFRAGTGLEMRNWREAVAEYIKTSYR